MSALENIDVRSGIFDSRDIDARITAIEAIPEADRDEFDTEELADLTALRDEVRGEWKYGITFIAESDFEDYARETAVSIGAIQEDAGWPMDFIDWERAADALKMDYTSIEIEGTTFYYREG